MYSNRQNYTILFLSILVIFFTSSCRKYDKISTDTALKLEFSTDTVLFDTVFTTIGSVTQKLMVYNNNDAKLNISSIRFGSGGTSNYRINIDGQVSQSADNVEIAAHDSLFVFVRVTVDPTNQDLPLVISDSLIFTTNGNIQNVKLVAWGQDAIFHRNEDLQGVNQWDSLKPHVIYGHLRVDTLGSLTIPAGTEVYFHKGAYLAVSSGSTLRIEGNLEHPVTFRSDRLDPYYRDLAGQWKGIYLERGSHDNYIDYAVIRNGISGLVVDSASVEGEPMLKVSNTIITNMSGDGIYAYATSITSVNCVIGDCGNTAVTLDFGGSYDFRQLTVGNYWGAAVRNTPSLYISNYTWFDTKVFNPLVKAYFGNTVIYGNQDEEVTIDLDQSVAGEYTFDHALLKTKLQFSDPNRFISCEKNTDPLFVNAQAFDYRPDSLSPLIGKGIPMGVPLDILGATRGSTPAIGAYERP